ncbi:MAG: hypothetical protein WC332_00940 [Clostridia bacterium]|jgi:hypothetical protein
MEEKNTDKTGAEPDKKEEIKKDATADSSTANKDDKDKKVDSSEADMPWHKDPRFKSELALLKTAKSLMEANGLEDVDELKDLIESGKKVYGKKVDLDKLDEIVGKAEKLDSYELYWAQQNELKRRNEETPEQTIARLEKQNQEISHRVTAKEQAEKDAQAAKQSVEFYEGEVKTALDLMDDLKPNEREFISWTLGVQNDCNEITLTDKKAVKKVITSGVKKYQKMVEAIKEEAIKAYLAGKESIPKVPSTDGASTATKPEPPKGLKGLRSAFMEAVSRKGD